MEVPLIVISFPDTSSYPPNEKLNKPFARFSSLLFTIIVLSINLLALPAIKQFLNVLWAITEPS